MRDNHEIVLNLAAYEFPWDTLQALSFALFRTYAVPSIGGLLDRTGEFTTRVQKRYDDTGLLLEEVLEHGLASTRGRAAVRRVNQMHAMYDISADDMRYVLATFVVIPKRWLDSYGYRPMTAVEVAATTNYYRELGVHLGIKALPEDFAAFERLLDDYERSHFGYDEGGRRVADSTLQLMTTFPPNNLAPARLVKRLAYSLMEDHLLDAFGYPRPGKLERALFTGALRLRGRLLRMAPARRTPKWARDFGYFRSYPNGFDVAGLGTFSPAVGCPVRPRPTAVDPVRVVS
ncbi:MAG: DUF2236 domain-containing protein [Actinomycetota bacterium]|nr:DUF2236 domain-containing protein [Actinomycetota bacterium]